jgi:hypothetical protein
LGGKPDYVHPSLSNFVKVTWLWHKSAMMSMMLLVEVKSHEKDHGSKKSNAFTNLLSFIGS